jgi:transposase-like protein
MDETHVKIGGRWKLVYRAVDLLGETVDFLRRRAHRDRAAARRFFERAMRRDGEPHTVTINKSDGNRSALQSINADRETPIRIRQVKYLNNVVEQDHHAIKRIIRPMMGFRNVRCARATC